VAKIRSVLPEACIAADVIVGFPTETDEHFEQTRQFIADLPISYLHTFTYSQRQKTLALKMENVVNPKVKKQRSQTLLDLSDRKRKLFCQDNIGKKRKVLFEKNVYQGFMTGWTDNYIKVYTPYQENLVNQIVEVQLNELYLDGFRV
jgi:threonylcarbamoyladenosine tRNA methylthiotransferase MtaB